MSFAPRLVVILGPTASGKSALGIRVAEKLSGEVVVCDSTQIYRGFDVGTAKVRADEQRGVPHHLVDIADPEEVFTAGDFRRRALGVLEDLRSRQKTPVITAGTGLYLRALLEGLADAPQRSEELRTQLRERAAMRGHEYLHRILARLDPEAAFRIAPRDVPKVIRAIEISLLAGRPITEVHRSGREALQGFSIRRIGLLPPRSELYARIDTRVETMLARGWLEEVRSLIDQGIPASAKPFQFIGYSQLRSHLEGALSLEDAVRQIQRATRHYAKRQITWFRREPNVDWLQGFGDSAETAHAAEALLEQPAS
jgi:tRNA dimethylallyltransferase